MANIELDGGNKKITVDSGDLTLDIPGDIILDADGGDVVFADGGTNLLKVTNSSSDVVFQPQVDAKDIIFKQYDGRNLLEINDGGYVAIANGATGPGQLRLYEDTDNGTNYTALQVGTQSGDITYTLPTADGSNGHALTTNGSGTLSWASAGTTYAGIDDQSSSNDDQLTITDTAVVINEDSDDVDFRVESNSNTHMLVVDAGNNRVHTGAANGGQILNVSGASTTTYEQALTHAIALAMPGIEIQNSSTTDGAGSCISFMDGGGFINAAIVGVHDDHDTNGDGYLGFCTRAADSGADTANERMRISNNGTIAVGHAGTTGSSLTGTGATGVYLSPSATTGASCFASVGDQPLTLNRADDTTNNITLLGLRRQNSVCGTIKGTNTTAQYNTSSDYRLKENVDYTWDATTRFKQLKPARFNWIVDKTNTLVDGFLAHEVTSIVPQAISGEKDAVDSEGNIDPQGIDHSHLVPLLTKALQEAITKIETLETKVAALEG